MVIPMVCNNYTGVEPTTKVFMEKVNAGPLLNTLTPQKARAVISELQLVILYKNFQLIL